VPTVVPTTTTQDVAIVPYTTLTRFNKFWVGLEDLNDGEAAAFEVFSVIQGPLNGTEHVDWVITHRIGFNFEGSIQINLDTVNNQLSLQWNNLHVDAVSVTVTRI
jgi:hypothetical protein